MNRVWGILNRAVSSQAGDLAVGSILPKLGFAELARASPFRRLTPFDVTTSMGKGGANARTVIRLAEVLRLPLVRVFIKPDSTGYMIHDASDGGNVLIGKVKWLPQ